MDGLPVRSYTKEELIDMLSKMDVTKKIQSGSDEEAALIAAAASDDTNVRDAASRAMVYRFRYIRKYNHGKTTSAEDILIKLAADIYMNRPTNTANYLKEATQGLVLDQLDSFYKIEAQNFYKRVSDYANDLDDYKQEAAACIFEKLDQYDPKKGKLSTFYKQQFYGRFMLLQSGDRKKYYTALNAKIDHAIIELAKEDVHSPTYAQIAQWINKEGGTREVSPRRVEKALKNRISYVPLDSAGELQSFVPGTEETVIRKDQIERVRQAARELDPVLQVIYRVRLESFEKTGMDVSDKDLKKAMKAVYPHITDREILKEKMEFSRQMHRKLGVSRPARRVRENLRNTAEADPDLFDAIEEQFPDGLPDR